MKTELAMGLIAKVATRGDQHGGKGKPAKTGGFGEALAAKIDARVEKRIPQDRRAERMDETRPNWRIGERLAFAIPRGEPVDDPSDLRDFLQPAAPDQPARDDPQPPDDMAAVALPLPEPHASETPRVVAAPPQAQRSETDAAAMPAQVAAPPALPPTEQVPQAAPDEAAPAATPAVVSGTAPAAPAMAAPTVAAPVVAAQTQQRPRGERGEPAEPAPTADASVDSEGEESEPTPAPRGEAATVAAATVPAEPRTTPARTEPAPRERQPVATAQAPADRTAPSAAPQPDGAAQQRPAAGAPGIAAANPEAPAAERAATPAPQAAETASGAQPRVTVLGFNAATPAPVMPVQLNPTAAGLVAAIGAEPTWRVAAAEAASAATQRGQGSISSLRIQLNPAELGMVTARLTVAGPQLEIEIRVESNDARQRLATDSDAIVKALRAIGYDIDKVTIQQAPQGGSPAPHQGGQARDSFLNGQGQAQERANGNAGGRNGQGNESGNGTGRRGTSETASEHSGGSVYI